MKQLICEMCGSTDLIKKDGVFVCQTCGCKYSVEEARKMMIEGTVSIDGVVKTKSDDFEVRAGELIAYHGEATDVVIPDGIKIIGKECFRGMQGIESVTIPEGVYKIEIGAFYQCNRLRTVVFSKSLVEIENGAFSGCIALAKIELPYGIKTLGRGFFKEHTVSYSENEYGCFEGCTSLKSIDLPESLEKIGDNCFCDCTSLEAINLYDKIQTLGWECFKGCVSLKSIHLPDGIQLLEHRCFSGCIALESIKLPNGLQKINSGCFGNNGGTYGNRYYSGCTSLKSVYLPDSIKVLGPRCFCGCTSLEFIHIPDNIQEIDNHAFTCTPALKTVELSDTYIKSVTLSRFGMMAAQYDDEIGNIDSPWFKSKFEELRKQEFEANQRKNSGCYIATAVYGSYDCPQVWTLRRYRDNTLAETWYGRVFIRVYYAVSPTLVKWFGHTEWFKKLWKGKLDRMVCNLNSKGVEDTPYTDRPW